MIIFEVYSVDHILGGLFLVESKVSFGLAESAVRSRHTVLLKKSFGNITPVCNTLSKN